MSCKEICMICSEFQYYRVNFGSYHGVCKNHMKFGSKFTKCRMCRSIVPNLFLVQKHCEDCNSENFVSCGQCNKRICEMCFGKNKICNECNKEQIRKCDYCLLEKFCMQIKCGHNICLGCFNYNNKICNVCEANETSSEVGISRKNENTFEKQNLNEKCNYCLFNPIIIKKDCSHGLCEACSSSSEGICPLCETFQKNEKIDVEESNFEKKINVKPDSDQQETNETGCRNSLSDFESLKKSTNSQNNVELSQIIEEKINLPNDKKKKFKENDSNIFTKYQQLNPTIINKEFINSSKNSNKVAPHVFTFDEKIESINEKDSNNKKKNYETIESNKKNSAVLPNFHDPLDNKEENTIKINNIERGRNEKNVEKFVRDSSPDNEPSFSPRPLDSDSSEEFEITENNNNTYQNPRPRYFPSQINSSNDLEISHGSDLIQFSQHKPPLSSIPNSAYHENPNHIDEQINQSLRNPEENGCFFFLRKYLFKCFSSN